MSVDSGLWDSGLWDAGLWDSSGLVPTPGRWTWFDTVTSETWTMPNNPRAASFPRLEASLESMSTPAQAVPRVRQRVTAGEASFSGTTTSQADYDALADWAGRRNIVQIADHLGTTWTLRITRCELVPKRSLGKPWRHSYTISALVLAVVDGVAP